MRKQTIHGIFAVMLVILALIAAGCVDDGTPKYIPGDIIAEKPTADTFLVILDYNQNTDEYKTNYISKVAGEWRYLVETKHESWENRRDREDLYPVKIGHVDLTNIMSWDEHLKEMGYGGVSVTPSLKQVPKLTPKLTPKPTSTFTPTPVITPRPTPRPVLTYQDSEYKEWAMGTAYIIKLDMELVTNAVTSSDFKGAEIYAGILYDDAKEALNEIDQFFVSPTLKPSKDEFKLALQNYKQVGYYQERGSRNDDVDDMLTAIQYIEWAIKHTKRATALIP